MFSDDDEENKIKKDSKIFINLFPGHLLFFIYLVSFLRGDGWVGEWMGREEIEKRKKLITYPNRAGPVLGPGYRGRP